MKREEDKYVRTFFFQLRFVTPQPQTKATMAVKHLIMPSLFLLYDDKRTSERRFSSKWNLG